MEELKFEVCANGVESCVAAQAGGADRVELCAGIPEGGTTPSYGTMKVARELLKTTRLHVIIRPRGGDFIYTPSDLRCMAADIEVARQIGADGVVFGCLTPEGDVDMRANAELMAGCAGLSVTFHRAFDRARDPMAALEAIVSLGFDRILTSGQQATAEKGIPLLAELQQRAAGRIRIMAGCGVNEGNISHIREATGVAEFHFSARVPVRSEARWHNPNVYMGAKGADEDTCMFTSEERVRNTIAAARQSSSPTATHKP